MTLKNLMCLKTKVNNLQPFFWNKLNIKLTNTLMRFLSHFSGNEME